MKRLFVSMLAMLLAMSSFAQTKLELAKQAMSNDDYDTAIQYTTDYLKTAPKDADAYAIRAKCFKEKKAFKAAIADADMAIKYWNNKNEHKLGTLYCFRGMIYESVNNEQKTIADYNTAVKKDSKNVICYSHRGDFYYKQQKYDKAASDYRVASSIEPTEPKWILGITRCLLRQSKEEEAIAILDSLILYEPMLAEAKQLRASVYFQQEDYKSFVDMYVAYLSLEQGELDMLLAAATKEYAHTLKAVTEKLKAATDNDTRFYWLGVRARVYQAKEQYNEALADLHSMQSLLSDSIVSPFILYYSAESYYGLYEYSEAAEYYSKLIAMDSISENSSAYLFKRAFCYSSLGRHQQSIADFTKIIENDIAFAPMAYYGRGLENEVLKEFDNAQEDYNKGLLLDENNVPLTLMRGRLLLLQKQDTIRANKDFKKILELDTIPVNSCRQYALVYMGKYDEAIEWNNKILETAPNADNYYDAACLYARMNRGQDALKYLKESLELGYRNFVHIEEDCDLDAIRNTQSFKELIAKYKKEGVQNIFNKLK
ncbi:MAG: tetratricopeptide repeat protein [Paludibacteraceae bacterium]|nr:tetratricopeptide repeat protein [Paludibacteraceae bacterium]